MWSFDAQTMWWRVGLTAAQVEGPCPGTAALLSQAGSPPCLDQRLTYDLDLCMNRSEVISFEHVRLPHW